MLAEALHKETVFKVTLTVPRAFLSPTQSVEASEGNNEVAIRVLHKQRGTDSVWTTDTLEEKVLTMREMYERMEEGGSLLVSPLQLHVTCFGLSWLCTMLFSPLQLHACDMLWAVAGRAGYVQCYLFQDESIGPDPFYDLEQHALLGVANFYLECINHDSMHDYTAPIVAPTGKVSWHPLARPLPYTSPSLSSL